MHMHIHQTGPVSPIYSLAILHLLRGFSLSLPSPHFSPLSSRPPPPSEFSEKIAEGQIRGWLPLCVTSKDKYSQDDSHCLENVYVCTCCSPTPTHLTHPIPSQHTYVCTCVSLETHSLLHPLCVQDDTVSLVSEIISVHHYLLPGDKCPGLLCDVTVPGCWRKMEMVMMMMIT